MRYGGTEWGQMHYASTWNREVGRATAVATQRRNVVAILLQSKAGEKVEEICHGLPGWLKSGLAFYG